VEFLPQHGSAWITGTPIICIENKELFGLLTETTTPKKSRVIDTVRVIILAKSIDCSLRRQISGKPMNISFWETAVKLYKCSPSIVRLINSTFDNRYYVFVNNTQYNSPGIIDYHPFQM
jgi:hypothetical protein